MKYSIILVLTGGVLMGQLALADGGYLQTRNSYDTLFTTMVSQGAYDVNSYNTLRTQITLPAEQSFFNQSTSDFRSKYPFPPPPNIHGIPADQVAKNRAKDMALRAALSSGGWKKLLGLVMGGKGGKGGPIQGAAAHGPAGPSAGGAAPTQVLDGNGIQREVQFGGKKKKTPPPTDE